MNFHNSKIDIVGVDEVEVHVYEKTFKCNRMSIPFKYLGMLD